MLWFRRMRGGRRALREATCVLIGLIGGALLMPVPVLAHGTVVERVVATSPIALRPALDTGRMVYVRTEGSFGSVWILDLASGATRKLSGEWSAFSPDIHSDRVVWEERRAEGSVIVLHDLATGESSPVSAGPHDHAPAVWGDRIVWTRECGTHGELIEYDVRSGRSLIRERVDVGATSDVCGDRLVFASGGTIERIDLRTGDRASVVRSSRGLEWPSVYGDVVAYATWEDGLSEVRLVDMRSGRSHTLASGALSAYAPALSGDRVAWESYGPGARVEVKVARLPAEFTQAREEDALSSARGAAAAIERLGCITRMFGSMHGGVIARIFG